MTDLWPSHIIAITPWMSCYTFRIPSKSTSLNSSVEKYHPLRWEGKCLQKPKKMPRCLQLKHLILPQPGWLKTYTNVWQYSTYGITCSWVHITLRMFVKFTTTSYCFQKHCGCHTKELPMQTYTFLKNLVWENTPTNVYNFPRCSLHPTG